jgi:hypothetical protein
MRTKLFTLIFIFSIFQSCGQKFSPSPEYIAQNKNKWMIELPEVQELVHIIIAITPTGIADANMVQHGTNYYKDVLANFEKHKNHNIVKKLDELLKKGVYARIKMDACGFYFDQNNRIVKDEIYKELNWGNKNYIQPHVKELEDFANITGFRQFYANNRSYYDGLIEMLKTQMPIEKQWKWLEERFPEKYDHYRITFSPLVSGSHSTNRFKANNFRQTVMFISGPIESDELSETVKEGLMTRVVFTEIDDNYVNPISDNYKGQLNIIFKDRSKWTSGGFSKSYTSPYAIFNEYMTWSVFTLYALDTYNENDFNTINERTEAQMTKRRGFSKFKEFNRQMIDLYRSKKANESIAALYPKILEWCKSQ